MASYNSVVENSTGYWGARTSTLDWCEKNYEVTFFIAEFWNTITNLMMILLPLYGIKEVFKQNFCKRFVFSHISLLAVGLGSWAFHMTLLYSMQLMDELPMVWGACYLLYSMHYYYLKMNSETYTQKPLYARIMCIFIAISFTILYMKWPIPLFHNTVYGLLITTSFVYELYIFHVMKCETCKRMFWSSFIMCTVAFFLWNIDRHLCPRLTSFRENLPTYARPITQLHGWWHWIVGYGFYLQILLSIHMYYDIEQQSAIRYYGLDTFRELIITDYGLNIRWRRKDTKAH